MELAFSAQEEAFAADVRNFLAEHLTEDLRKAAAATPGVFAEPDIALEWSKRLNQRGWLAYHWPVEHGGPGWTPTQRYVFEKECAIAGAPALPAMGLRLLAPVIWTFGTPAQKAAILPRILSGEDYWCQGFSEPGSGSDLASLKTIARRDGNHYLINGSKIWTTHAHHANRIFCLVRTGQGKRPQDGISFLLLDLDQPGVSVRPIITLAGDHEVNEVFFDDARTPTASLVGAEGQGWSIAKFLLENERGGSCYGPKLLSDIAAIESAAREEAGGRDAALADDADFRRRIGELRIAAEALEATELRVLSEVSRGNAPGPQTSLTKFLASRLRQDIDELAMNIYALHGLRLAPQRPLYGPHAPAPVHTRGAQVAPARYLNSRAWTIFGGTNEVQANIVAKTILGL